MAWIESHQTLRDHPKVRKAARALDVGIPQLIGHLHCLWHQALDLALDGDLTRWDAADIAYAAMWDGDPDAFVDALTGCGFADGPGFLEVESDGHLVIHDWEEHTRHLVARQEASAQANHTRWHVNRGVVADDCHLCDQRAPDDQKARDSTGTPSDDPDSSERTPHGDPDGSPRNPPDRTGPDRNGPDQGQDHVGPDGADDSPSGAEVVAVDDDPGVSEDARLLCATFARLVQANGAKPPKRGTKANRDWLIEADRLLRLGPSGGSEGDGPDVDLAIDVAEWATSHHFWRSNVLSIPKFRDQWTRLQLQYADRNRTRGRPDAADIADRYDQAAAELAAQGR